MNGPIPAEPRRVIAFKGKKFIEGDEMKAMIPKTTSCGRSLEIHLLSMVALTNYQLGTTPELFNLLTR